MGSFVNFMRLIADGPYAGEDLKEKANEKSIDLHKKAAQQSLNNIMNMKENSYLILSKDLASKLSQIINLNYKW